MCIVFDIYMNIVFFNVMCIILSNKLGKFH